MTISEFRSKTGIQADEMSDDEVRAEYGDLIDEGQAQAEGDGMDELARTLAKQVMQAESGVSGGDGASQKPDVNPNAERSDESEDEEDFGFETNRSPSKSKDGSGSGVRLKRDALEKDGKMAINTLKMWHYHKLGKRRQRNEAFDKLARGGHYGQKVQRNIQKRASDYYNTLVGDEGGILLPVTVRDEIDRLAENVGAFRQFARTVTGLMGTTRFPAASSQLKADAIQEGGDIKIDRRSLQGVDLDPRKWAKAVAWTLETENEQVAQSILDDAEQAVADGFARAEDDAGLNGDGTSTYNNITGILNLSGTSTYTLASGNTNFADIDPDDLKLANNDLPAGNRAGTAGKAFLFDETMDAVFSTKKDDNGQYLFDEAFRGDTDPSTLWGIPVFYTEELPGTDVSAGNQTDSAFGILAIRRHWIMGMGGAMTTSTLTEATLKDQNDNDVRLGSQDLTASVFREWFDIQTNFPETAVIFKTASS